MAKSRLLNSRQSKTMSAQMGKDLERVREQINKQHAHRPLQIKTRLRTEQKAIVFRSGHYPEHPVFGLWRRAARRQTFGWMRSRTFARIIQTCGFKPRKIGSALVSTTRLY